MALKYLEISLAIEKCYMKVTSENKLFYKGICIVFNGNETKLKSIIAEHWHDIGVCRYITKEISKKEYDTAYNKAMDMLNKL
ncbi:hypothetical protein [Riemerella anatipestifer]|uniref:hypothetical protein n=1 Tax=Riemerella anatipestifer TaxID=34085 RepID=UPI00208E8DAA|nr:hypothetical protein [Riemerella anatipestifer]MCO4303216.1 hypothetical protein [Riemerella anatipestifer]MCO7353628.1 hypothetical protein [Riemerella anatipestifer]MCQ4039010.1 hypothetical protein [Riemerella anatipestifer]MCT6759948.1 hypothetical protein [Riemerella anatipestifer]MCT6764187.1 hypothetical protein [Riemerella anatipestifer]